MSRKRLTTILQHRNLCQLKRIRASFKSQVHTFRKGKKRPNPNSKMT
jgi:hypothetical protein